MANSAAPPDGKCTPNRRWQRGALATVQGADENDARGRLWATLRADPWTRKTLLTGLPRSWQPTRSTNCRSMPWKIPGWVSPSFRRGVHAWPYGHRDHRLPYRIGTRKQLEPRAYQEMAEAIALEGRLQGAHIGYGPILDLAREPLVKGGRDVWRRPGADGKDRGCFHPWITGDDTGDGVTYTLPKHFAPTGTARGHNGQNATIGSRDLFSNHLEPFRVAVETGLKP